MRSTRNRRSRRSRSSARRARAPSPSKSPTAGTGRRCSGPDHSRSSPTPSPSQMGLEDLAMMRAVYGSTVLYPSDGNQTAKLVAQMADRDGITYMRTTREKTPIIYDKGESFPIGGSKVVRESNKDRATI